MSGAAIGAPKRPPLMRMYRDENGVVTSLGIYVEPCANEPPETAELREHSDFHVPWVHGLATYVFDEGATLLCNTCGWERRQEEARQARLRRVPPIHRAWLLARGIEDWPPSPAAPSHGTGGGT